MQEDNIFIQIGEFGELLTGGIIEYGPLIAPLLLVSGGLLAHGRYRMRRRIEERITGRGASMKNVVTGLKLSGDEVLADKHPGMPAVPVYMPTVEQVIHNLQKTSDNWTTPTGTTEEPHLLISSRSRHGKNEIWLDPIVWNCLFRRRKDALVINDVKGAMHERFRLRTSRPQYVYTFDPRHADSASINLISSPHVAEMTAAALYRIGGSGQIYAQTALSFPRPRGISRV